MGRISDSDRSRNEEAIRAAMDRLLRGDIPSGGRCDLKTLAAEAGVTRTGFYPKKDRDGTVREGSTSTSATSSYAAWRLSGNPGRWWNPRDAQIERLKAHNTELKGRVADRDKTVEELTAFKKLALSRLAAQHDEIMHLRSQPSPVPAPLAKLATVPRAKTAVIGSCS